MSMQEEMKTMPMSEVIKRQFQENSHVNPKPVFHLFEELIKDAKKYHEAGDEDVAKSVLQILKTEIDKNF